MRGTFVLKYAQLSIDISGEQWQQGSTISGILKQESNTDNSVSIGAHLCSVNIKKLKTKDPKSVTLIESLECTNDSSEFQFKLSNDCLTTDTANSLYLLCGNIEEPLECGIMQLNITPKNTIISTVEIIETFLKFKFKKFKHKKGFVSAKVVAPDTNDWKNIQSMSIAMRANEEQLDMVFNFKVKKMSYEGANVATKDENEEYSITLDAKKYILFEDKLDQDYILEMVNQVLDKVRLKSFV